ncbi:MAG: quinone-dependent dihydroorotate dehydrogenase [Rhodobacteraceae bacterium]|nr:quinone-dependent dihydroorotate dehydrogenase [Paracoccaceae bacterium]
MLEKLGLPFVHRLDPETAHGLALRAMRMGLSATPGVITSSRLKCEIAGLSLPNPVGLAAGFDKNAVAIAPLLQTGFGFIEVGAATPKPQPGNPKPRLFRLDADRAAINRFGFNNQGADAIAARLAQRPEKGIVGINLGANKTSKDKSADFASVLKTTGPFVDFATVNVSSPNTERLRDLQGKAALTALLNGVMAARDTLEKPVPIFLKIAPDLSLAELQDITEAALLTGISGIIATNTTLSRDGLQSPQKDQAGGLSGAPLFDRSTQVLAQLYQLLEGRIPLIGVGGISTAQDAYAKICAGASIVQLYTAMVFEGTQVVRDVIHGLEDLLQQDGYANIAEAVGTKTKEWL